MTDELVSVGYLLTLRDGFRILMPPSKATAEIAQRQNPGSTLEDVYVKRRPFPVIEAA